MIMRNFRSDPFWKLDNGEPGIILDIINFYRDSI